MNAASEREVMSTEEYAAWRVVQARGGKLCLAKRKCTSRASMHMLVFGPAMEEVPSDE